MLYILINNFSVMLVHFPGLNKYKQYIKCLAQGHNTVIGEFQTSKTSISSLTLNNWGTAIDKADGWTMDSCLYYKLINAGTLWALTLH